MVYLPLASQHLDVKTIGRGGPLRRLLKPDKGRPFLRACKRLPVEVAPQVGMSVRGAAVFLRVGYVAGHCMAYIRLQTRSGDVSVGSKGTSADDRIKSALLPRTDVAPVAGAAVRPRGRDHHARPGSPSGPNHLTLSSSSVQALTLMPLSCGCGRRSLEPNRG